MLARGGRQWLRLRHGYLHERQQHCRAALHAGVIGKRGGPFFFMPQPAPTSYVGVTRNGLPSRKWGLDGDSFGNAAVGVSVPPPAPPQGGPVAASAVCPDNFAAFAGTS